MSTQTMSTQTIAPKDCLPTEYLARTIGAVALAAVAIIHVVDLPNTLQETPLVGDSYFLLIATALLGAALLISVVNRLVWAFADLIAVAAIVAYVFSRTTGLPSDRVDLGNWNCALGIAAISVEALVVLLAAWRIQPHRALAESDVDAIPAPVPTPFALNNVRP
jgi:hypothetical protein